MLVAAYKKHTMFASAGLRSINARPAVAMGGRQPLFLRA